jgi:hypothetical protein
MALSVEEALMNFGYTYAPNLIHQGASVITEILSALIFTRHAYLAAGHLTYYFCQANTE